MTINPIDALERLDAFSLELDSLSKELEQVERALEPVDREYEAFMGAYEEGLWFAHTDTGQKFPPEALRTRMGHRAMPPDLLGRYTGLQARRKRLEKRIRSVTAGVGAARSIVSALKEEQAAAGYSWKSAA